MRSVVRYPARVALSADDLADIARVIDQRLAVDRRAQTARRRWRRVVLLLLMLTASVVGWLWLRSHLDRLHGQLAEQAAALQDARLAYQRELQRSNDVQRERAAAIAAAGYVSGQPRAVHEADLLRGVIRLYGQAQATQGQVLAAGDDDDDLVAAAVSSAAVAQDGGSLLMRLLLGATDPAHNDASDQRQSALAAEGTPALPTAPPPAH